MTKCIEAGDNIRSMERKPSGDETSDSDVAPICRPVGRDLAALRGCHYDALGKYLLPNGGNRGVCNLRSAGKLIYRLNRNTEWPNKYQSSTHNRWRTSVGLWPYDNPAKTSTDHLCLIMYSCIYDLGPAGKM